MAACAGWRDFTGQVVDAFDQRGLHGKDSVLWHCSGACLEYVPGTPICRYVPVPAGVALGRIDEAEASVHTQALKDPDQLTELESPANEEVGSEENRR